MEGAVGNHLHVTAPAVEGTDYAPGAHVLIGGIRVFLLCDRADDTGRTCSIVQDEVVQTVFGNHDIGTVLTQGEVFAQGVGAHAFGITEVDGPVGVLAELDLVTGGELDSLGHMEGAVGPHFIVVGPAVERTDQAPGTLLGVTAIRVAGRKVDFVCGNGDFPVRVDIAVAAIVTGLLLHGGADDHFQGYGCPFRVTHIYQGLAQVGGGNGYEVAFYSGCKAFVEGTSIEGSKDQPVVQSHLGIEVQVGGSGSKGDGKAVVRHLVLIDDGSGSLGCVKHRQLLLDAGYGNQCQNACR